MTILSTKKLTTTQKALLAAYKVLEVPMISIVYGKGLAMNEKIEHAVFTSVNSVIAVFEKNNVSASLFQQVYCVGTKTKSALEKHGIQVTGMGKDGATLAQILITQFDEIQEISWFCGNLKSNDLPSLMAQNGVMVAEYEVYQTQLTPQEINQSLDAILFYSPSGILSFVQKNKALDIPVVCIGNTTATEALKHFNKVYISNTTTVEAVLEKAKEVLSD